MEQHGNRYLEAFNHGYDVIKTDEGKLRVKDRSTGKVEVVKDWKGVDRIMTREN